MPRKQSGPVGHTGKTETGAIPFCAVGWCWWEDGRTGENRGGIFFSAGSD